MPVTGVRLGARVGVSRPLEPHDVPQPQPADPRRLQPGAVRSTTVDVSAAAALDPSGLDAVAVLVHADGDLPERPGPTSTARR